MTIKAIKEIREGNLIPIHAIHFLDPVTFATNINITAGIAEIAAKIDNFSIAITVLKTLCL